MSTDDRVPALRGLLSLHGFRRLLAVRYPSQFADGLFQVAAAGLILFALDPFEQTSATQVAAVLAITSLPFTVVGPLAGVAIDRWRRRHILAWSGIARIAIIVAALPIVSRHALAWEHGEVVFYAAILAVLSVNRFVLATLGAVLPRVAPGEALVPANAVSATGGSIVTLAGASAGGGMAALIGDTQGGPEAAVALSVLFTAASVVAARRFSDATLGPALDSPPPPLRHELRAGVRDIADGIRAIRGSRRAWAPMSAFAIMRLVITAASIAALLVLRNVFGGGSGAVALFLVSFGVGIGLGAAIAWVLDRTSVRTETILRGSLVTAGLSILLLGPSLNRLALLAMAALTGLAFGAAKVTADTLVQSSVADRWRGRLFAAYDVIVNLAVVGGGVLAAVLLPTTAHADDVLVGFGGATILLVVVSRRWLRRLPPPVDVETWEEARAVE